MSESDFKKKIIAVIGKLRKTRRPSRNAFVDAAKNLSEWKQRNDCSGLWHEPPLMATATLDDGFGHGLEIIHLYAEAAGLKLLRLGLMLSPDDIIAKCLEHHPSILGLTMLQFDTETSIKQIRDGIRSDTQIVAGGPLFAADPGLAKRSGIDVVTKDAAAFMEYLLRFPLS